MSVEVLLYGLGELARELRLAPPGQIVRELAPGLVSLKLAPADSQPLAYLRQTLPAPKPIEGESISRLAANIVDCLIEREAELQAGWRLHVYPANTADSRLGTRRCQLISAAIFERLKSVRRTVHRAHNRDGSIILQRNESLAQVLLVEAGLGFISIASPALRQSFSRGWFSPTLAGLISIEDDLAPPSRAFKKLLEAEERFGRSIVSNELCVDLGCSPGSWSYLALKRGARVIGVDRSAPRDDLMKNPQFQFMKGDAFKYRPTASVAWLLSDIVAYPDRITTLLQEWVTKAYCLNFCVTMKFKGEPDHATLCSLKAWLKERQVDYDVKRLDANKNEVTFFGETAAPLAVAE